MYYHMVSPTASLAEVTLLAKSANGVTNWTRVGPVLDWPSSAATGYPDSGSFGYFRPFQIGGVYYGHSLLQGTNWCRFGLWMSYDGVEWILDPRPLGNNTRYVGQGKRINWNHGDVIYWNSQMWWVGIYSDFSSGGGTTISTVMAAPISPNFRQFLAPPSLLLPTLQGWESNPQDLRGAHCLVDSDGSLVYVYANNGTTTGFGLASGV
jgi:hypothetical protein